MWHTSKCFVRFGPHFSMFAPGPVKWLQVKPTAVFKRNANKDSNGTWIDLKISCQICTCPKDHWTLQWKGLNLCSRDRVLKIASFEGSGYLGCGSQICVCEGGLRPFSFRKTLQNWLGCQVLHHPGRWGPWWRSPHGFHWFPLRRPYYTPEI